MSSPLCTAGRHDVCTDLPYTGCGCRCHPEAVDRPPRAAAPAVPTRPAAAPVVLRTGGRSAARALSWVLVGHGLLVLVPSTWLVVDGLFLSDQEGLAGLAALVLGALLLPVGLVQLVTGLLARRRGVTAPALGVLAPAILGPALLAPVVLGEVALVSTLSGLLLYAGLPWFRSADRPGAEGLSPAAAGTP